MCQPAENDSEVMLTNSSEMLEIARWSLHQVRLSKSARKTVVLVSR